MKLSLRLVAGAIVLFCARGVPSFAHAQQHGENGSDQSEPAAQPAPGSKDSKHDNKAIEDNPTNRRLTEAQRLLFIRKAHVWQATDIPAMDVKTGPRGKDAFESNEQVTCEFRSVDLSGATPKFECTLEDGDVVKVRYGEGNGEVFGHLIATRLLWALGFGADRAYPVRVTCLGCSADPWKTRKKVAGGRHTFEMADIERKPSGIEMEGQPKGWSWTELDQQVNDTKAERDALKLLAVFMQHTDSKAEQQRLICLPGGLVGPGVCEKPFMFVKDVGLTFGHGNLMNHRDEGSVNLEAWSAAPVWRNAKTCEGHLSKSATGTLDNPIISEAGRQFLASLLEQLTDGQLHDLFDVARVDRRSRKPGTSAPPASVDEWVDVFKHKRDEILTVHCPA